MTEYVSVRGKVKWFRHITPDRKYDPARWNHVMYPDNESLEKIRDLQSEGVKNVLKKDEDGYWITWSRHMHIKRKGGLEPLPSPVVIYKDQPLSTENVGNGSDVVTTLEVYSHRVPGSDKKAKAARWHSSRIENLIPFEKKTDYLPDEKKAVDEMDKVPVKYF